MSHSLFLQFLDILFDHGDVILVGDHNLSLIFLYLFIHLLLQKLNVVIQILVMLLNLSEIVLQLLKKKKNVGPILNLTIRKLISRWLCDPLREHLEQIPTLSFHYKVIKYNRNMSKISTSFLLGTNLLLLLLLILLFLYQNTSTKIKSAAFFRNYSELRILSYSSLS